MACAGMGDVLTGIIGALITQGAYSHSAVVAGVYLHGLAADQLLSDNKGPIGMTASETIDTSRSILNQHLTGILA
jgi:NAD(P)H-hydrate repair Nnr-like enzyme with NAD(P)H-hydrate dehydratase domain